MLGHWNAQPYFIVAILPTPMLGHWNALPYLIFRSSEPYAWAWECHQWLISQIFPTPVLGHWNAQPYFIAAIFPKQLSQKKILKLDPKQEYSFREKQKTYFHKNK